MNPEDFWCSCVQGPCPVHDKAYADKKAVKEIKTPRKKRGSVPRRGLSPTFEGGGEAGRVIKTDYWNYDGPGKPID